MRTLAAVAWDPGQPLRLEEVELDAPRPDEILVEIAAVGVCHTDVRARDGQLACPLPMIPGHEGAGTVVEVGAAVTRVAVGDKVLLTSDRCGRCRRCLTGRSNYCEAIPVLVFSGARADGSPRAHQGGRAIRAAFFGQSSFSRYALATERSAFVVPPDSPLELLAALTCGVPTGAGSVLYALPVVPGASFVVYGAGAVGLAALMAAVAVGATRIVAVDRVSSRLELATELGATLTIDTTACDDVLGAIRDHTAGGADAALDTTGDPGVLALAVGALGGLGVCGMVTTRAPEVALPTASMLLDGTSFRGIVGGHAPPEVLLPRLLSLHAAGLFPFERLVRNYPFSQINGAIDDSLSGRVVKPVLVHAS